MSKIEYVDNAALVEIFPDNDSVNHDIVIVDIRNPGEYAAEYIEGSVNIPLDELLSSDKQQFKDKVILFHCKGGVRTRANQHILEAFNSKQSLCLEGGIEQWKNCGRPVKKA